MAGWYTALLEKFAAYGGSPKPNGCLSITIASMRASRSLTQASDLANLSA